MVTSLNCVFEVNILILSTLFNFILRKAPSTLSELHYLLTKMILA